MPLGLAMHGKWDGISMASPPIHTYKHERPAYSTPQPVENTPANNECRMVELRGAKVASFFVGGDEFICLPQAFDLFLKHLVGGLHTVYTKLKRLSISPVVCNVEQVRILRGLGAIQPGVNRCKLITRKDFETLYQDCTQASRPGRPPKRYPMLPPTDLMAHHPGIRSLNSTHGMLTASDISNLHKRMRLEQDVEKHLQQQQHERRVSGSPPKDSSLVPGKDITLAGGNEIHPNATNLYLQAQQALRQQYQQVATSGLHNGLDTSHAAVAAAGMNPALAPLMMMSHSALFSGGIPPSMLNHINQFAQSHVNGNAVTSAAAAAAAQIAANGGTRHQQAAAVYQVAAAAQSAAQASLAATGTSKSNSPIDENRSRSASQKDGPISSNREERMQPFTSSIFQNAQSDSMNGIDSEGRVSPVSSISSPLEDENFSNGSLSGNSDSRDSVKFFEDNEESLIKDFPSPTKKEGSDAGITSRHENQEERFDVDDVTQNNSDTKKTTNSLLATGITQVLASQGNISSMQTLLTNIQGLLKVAADNAKLQEKHSSFEMADLKNRINHEKEIRGSVEQKLEESERIRVLMQRRLKKERKVRKLLQEQLITMQQKIDNRQSEKHDGIASAPSIPIRGVIGMERDTSEPQSESLPQSQKYLCNEFSSCEQVSSPLTAETDCNSSPIAQTISEASPSSMSNDTSHLISRECGPFSSRQFMNISSSNNNNNKNTLIQSVRDSPSPTLTGQELSVKGISQKKDLPLQSAHPGSHMFFKASFQTTMSQ
ncbi:uncharacterized protein LOC120340800 [Styela clava]